ncbi:DUF7114 family protein [Natronorarus salvus]|uniref:DUF7114 family protein n=1 Tax=Natronorarus salvus TaxID=3117733 RepID=UPI002F268A7D
MEAAEVARRGAREAIADVEPTPLRERIEAYLDRASMVPAVLTVASARSVDRSVDDRAITERAAGVQLIYDGLGLTRTLVREEPWASGGDVVESDIEVLAADVLVSRGFYLLAMGDAAEAAVEVVRSFGRDETNRRSGVESGSLEADVFALAGLAGASVAGERPSEERLATLSALGRSVEPPLPEARAFFARGDPRLSHLDRWVADAEVSATDP